MIGEMKSHDIEALLKSQIVGHLGCYAGGVTYVIPISYAYDGEYIYCHSLDGMKIKMMRQNPQVCFQTDKMENMANWQSVIAWGQFEELKTKEGRKEALQKLMDRVLPVISSETTHLSPHWPFPPEEMGNIKGIVFRIRVQKKTGRFEKTLPEEIYATG
jgi:nitroimidazol reductase NimA-like FMN-containing flavoprotein (pyridoxamine 5'-phosphate oxidase superfamily)